MKTLKFLSFICISTLIVTSCSSDDDSSEPINEEEVITTLIATLTPTTGANVVLTFRDLDGDGPNPPQTTVSSALAADMNYEGSLSVLNETQSPAENINAEIEEEKEAHQFFYQVATGLNISNLTYVDLDGNGNPVGLNFSFDTGAASSGTMTITLRHEPNKDAAGVSEGDITNAGGETDLSVSFPLAIE